MAWMVTGFFTTLRLQAQQQTQTVKGVVIDKASEKPLAGVSVTVAGMSMGTTTDSTGSFKMTSQYAKHVRIRDGYVYYIYRPSDSVQKKYLYKERIDM